MKHCPQCEFTFDDQQQLCDFDGTELSVVPEKLPSFKTVSLVPPASGSFLGRLVKSPAALAVLALVGVALSALLIGHYDSVNQRDIDISKSQIRSHTPTIVTTTQVDTVPQMEPQADRPRAISTQRRIGAEELPPSMVKRLLKGAHSRPVRLRRDPSRSSLLTTKRKAESANRQARARNQARPESREAGNANRQSRARNQARQDSRERVRQQHSAARVAHRRPVVSDNEPTHRTKDSKVVSILKKTGKILKRPFEFIAGR